MKQNIKKISGLCTVILLLINIMAVTVFSASVNDIGCSNSDKAYAIYLYNSTDNKSLYEQNIDKVISPASTVKLMTALVAFEGITDPQKEITITQNMLEDIQGNSLELVAGEKISFESLLIGLVCGGYNDVAKALAISTAGSVDKFVSKMNAKAQSLGALNTIYKEPTGIDDSAQTTAYDTMLVAKEFMKNEILSAYSSLPSYKIPPTNKSEERHIYNRNALKSSYSTIKYLNANAIGMNAGMTSGGGYCVVTGVKNEGVEYICVVMGAKHGAESDTTYSYAIANELIAQITKLGNRLIISSDKEIGSLPIKGASLGKESVSLRTAGDVAAYLPADYESSGLLELTYIYSVNELVAPAKEGDVVGRVVVSYDGDIVAISDIVIAETVEREFIIYALWVIRSFLVSRTFIFILLSLAVIVITKFIVFTRIAHKKGRYVGRKF